MKKTLPVIALILALGYLAPLSMFPWASEGASSFEKQVWFLSLAMLCLNAVGIGLLYRLSGNKWTLFALMFCGFQVVVWWWFSGIRSLDGSLGEFLVQKIHAMRALLGHSDIRVAIATVHQDIAIGLVYHVALLWLLIEFGIRRNRPPQGRIT